VYLFDIASRHMNWLAERQSITASNIANADTPGYTAQSAAAFSAILDHSKTALSTTSPLHISLASDAASGRGGRFSAEPGESWGISHSGNSVSIEQELLTANSTSRMMGMDVNLTHAFQRMLLASIKT
jgi:flagellar basal-body rod protein FlgB